MRRSLLALPVVALLAPSVARAQSSAEVRGEPSDTAREEAPRRDPLFMLSETARIVDVVDSFDRGSLFSFRLSAGYLYQHRTATIEREASVSGAAGLGGVEYRRIGDYIENTHTLMVNAEFGLFHDLSFTFGLPLILANTREIRGLSQPGANEGNAALGDGWTQNNAPASLFSVPFRSPDRAGIDQVRLGLSWSILNQQRDRTKPTWTLRFEWRPPVGDTMHACNADAPAGSAQCPAPSSVPTPPGAGSTNSMGAPVRPVSAGSPGISRGLNGIYFQTEVARRVGFVEPYAALDMLAEFPQRDTPFRYFDTPYGQLASYPPLTASLVVGAELIPYENRETWQRVVIDLRFRGTYRSQGRDYSPLYDALGSSGSRALAAPGCPSNARDPSGACQPGREVWFDGLTTTASNMTLNGMINIAAQPAKFVRFDLGLGMSWVTPHLITATDACNPNSTVPAAHPEWRGGCVNDSAPDPTHRAAIDQSGGRFRTSGETLFDVFFSASFTPRFF